MNLIKNCMKYSALSLAVIGMTAGSVSFAKDANTDGSESTSEKWSDKAGEAWLQGKAESVFMLNEHLSAFDINTAVKNKEITLEGQVQNEVQKELASELALSVDGIESVQNNLKIDENTQKIAENKSDTDRSFMQTIKDASLTASVKTRLIGSEVKARNINVETYQSNVTLKGTVESKAHSDLAEKIAKNTDDVKDVVNDLEIYEEVEAE